VVVSDNTSLKATSWLHSDSMSALLETVPLLGVRNEVGCMERRTLLRGTSLLISIISAMQERIPARADQVHFTEGPVRVMLNCLVRLHAVVTIDRTDLLEDIRLLAALMHTVDLHVRTNRTSLWTAVVDAELCPRCTCGQSVFRNVQHLHRSSETCELLDDFQVGAQKVTQYSKIVAPTDELRCLWEAPMCAVDDVIAILRCMNIREECWT
jgi:hypothetical protein